MIEKKIEQVSYDYVYVAADGTEFADKGECQAYENSAYGVLRGRLAKIALKQMSECDLFDGAGCDENESFIVVPKSEEEVTHIQQLAYMKAYNKETQAEKVAVGKVLVVTFSCDGDCVWIADLGEIVSKATDGKYKVVEAE